MPPTLDGMELWTKQTRFYAFELYRDLYGPAVLIYYGGKTGARTRIIPVSSTVEGEKKLDELATRRRQHGYRLTSPDAIEPEARSSAGC